MTTGERRENIGAVVEAYKAAKEVVAHLEAKLLRAEDEYSSIATWIKEAREYSPDSEIFELLNREIMGHAITSPKELRDLVNELFTARAKLRQWQERKDALGI